MGKKIKTTFSTDEVAAAFGVTARAVQLWHQSGCPRVKRGRWNLQEVILWWAENIYTACNRGDDVPGSELNLARTAYWQAKAEKMALDVEKTREAMLSKSEVITAWTERVVGVAAGLEALADRLPPLLAGLSAKAMHPVIKREVRTLREGFARKGRYCPTPGPLTKLLVEYHEKEKADG